MLSPLVWGIAMTLLRLLCPVLSVAEYSLTEIPENSTRMKNDQEPIMKEVPGQCRRGGKMDVSKATW